MEQFESDLQKTPSTVGTSGSLEEDFRAFKAFTTEMLRGFQKQLGFLAASVDSIETHSRRKFLLLHGVPEDKQEDTSALVVNTIASHLKIKDFGAAAISRCQRMGRVSNDKPRPILVKLRDRDIRNKIWFSKTSLKGTNITLSEFLTKARHQTFMDARQRFGVKSCWTRDGYIYVIAPDGKRYRISSICELGDIPVTKAPAPRTAAAKKADPVSKRRK